MKQSRMLRSLLVGFCGAGLLAVALVAWTGLHSGRSPAERAATSLVMPIGLMWLLLLAGGITSWRLRRRSAAILLIAMFLIVGIAFNNHVAGRFLRSLQYPTDSDPMSSLQSTLDAVVLLGGYASDNRFGVPEINDDGQRFLLAAQLWHAGKCKTLICTGTGTDGRRDQSRIGRDLLLSVGVANDVIFEVPGPNTDAEMRNLKEFFDAPPDAWLAQISPSDSSIGLITSAMHLSRAMRLAAARDLSFVPLGCNFRGDGEGTFSPRELIPTAGSGKTFASALKEYLASWVGR